MACGPPDWVGALKRVQGESCPGWHPTVDPLAGWPKASDEHVLKQTALTPSFARGSRLQTTPKGRKEQATCQGPPGQPERTCCAVKRKAIKGRPLPSPLGRAATRGACKLQEEPEGELEEDEYQRIPIASRTSNITEKRYLRRPSILREPNHNPIPKGDGLNVPGVAVSAEVPRHDGLKTFSPSWTKVV